MHFSDQELIEQAKGGDKQAFVALFDRYKNRISGYLYGYVGDYAKAQDLTIETFLKVYEHLGGYKELQKFSSWIYAIASNCAKNELRKRKYRTEISLEKPVGGEGGISLSDIIADDRSRPDYNARMSELKELIYKLLAKLDKKYRDVLLLCDIDGLPYEKAAKILKVKAKSIGTRLARARNKLYGLLKKYGYDF